MLESSRYLPLIHVDPLARVFDCLLHLPRRVLVQGAGKPKEVAPRGSFRVREHEGVGEGDDSPLELDRKLIDPGEQLILDDGADHAEVLSRARGRSPIL